MKTYEEGLREASQIAQQMLDPDRRQLAGTETFHAGADWAARSMIDAIRRKLLTPQMVARIEREEEIWR